MSNEEKAKKEARGIEQLVEEQFLIFEKAFDAVIEAGMQYFKDNAVSPNSGYGMNQFMTGYIDLFMTRMKKASNEGRCPFHPMGNCKGEEIVIMFGSDV